MFRCNSCAYQTIKKFNMNKHIKNVHKRDATGEEMVRINITPENIQITPEPVQITPEIVQITSKKVEITPKNVQITLENGEKKFSSCPKCSKNFKTFQGLRRHQKKTCKGVSNILECHFCHRVLATQQSKSQHLKTCKIKHAQEQMKAAAEQKNHITTNTNHGQIINQYINNNYRISNKQYQNKNVYNIDHESTQNINEFGKEDISYITDGQLHDIASNYKVKSFIMLKHFDPEHPENHNIRKKDNKAYHVFLGNKWSLEAKDIVHSTIYNNSKAEIHNYAYTHVLPSLNEPDTNDYLYNMIQYDRINKKNILKTIEVKAEELTNMKKKENELIQNAETNYLLP